MREPRLAITTSPSPAGRTVTSSPARRPAARIASTGSVTWFLDETFGRGPPEWAESSRLTDDGPTAPDGRAGAMSLRIPTPHGRPWSGAFNVVMATAIVSIAARQAGLQGISDVLLV